MSEKDRENENSNKLKSDPDKSDPKNEKVNKKKSIPNGNYQEKTKLDGVNTMPYQSSQEETKLNEEDILFDFEKLRLSQNFSELVGVKKAILTIPVRKPNRHEFIWVRSGEEWRFETAVLELKEERETYLVDKMLWPILANELVPKILFTVVNRQNVLSLWPIRLPGEDGRIDQWNRSALEAAEVAQKRWIRLSSNVSLGAYEVHLAEADFPEPEWPEISFKDILKIAFRDNFIQTPDHPVIQRLRGLV